MNRKTAVVDIRHYVFVKIQRTDDAVNLQRGDVAHAQEGLGSIPSTGEKKGNCKPGLWLIIVCPYWFINRYPMSNNRC
jgi:hypothetical protein